jgi:predicted carbohydrate-binding protein with CBM5 and CBM33 domain
MTLMMMMMRLMMIDVDVDMLMFAAGDDMRLLLLAHHLPHLFLTHKTWLQHSTTQLRWHYTAHHSTTQHNLYCSTTRR